MPGTARSDAVAARSGVRRDAQVSALAYDATRDQLLAAVIADDGSTSLHGLDPATLETRWTLPAPDTIYRLAISADGSTLYGAMTYSATVWQVDLTRRAGVRQFVVGDAAGGEGPADLTIRPGSPGTVVVSIKRWDLLTPAFQRLTVYDDGVARPKSTSANGEYGLSTGANEIEFVDADHAVAYDNNSTGCTLSRLVLLPDGLRHETSTQNPGYCFGDRLSFSDGHLITSAGLEYDPVTLSFLRAWPGVSSDTGASFLDVSRGSFVRVMGGNFAALNADTRPRAAVEEYETTRHTLRRSFVTDDPIPVTSAYVLAIANTGSGRLAFTVLDGVTGRVALHAHDFNAVPTVGAWNFASSSASAEGVTGVAIDLPALDVAYDASLQRLVLALPPGLGPNGNSLAIMHPATGAVERLIPLSGQPAIVRIAPSGGIAYVAMRGAFSVVQVDLVAGTVLRQAAVRADALAIKPDDASVIAVLKNDTLSNPTITVLRDMVPQGNAVDLWAIHPNLTRVNWLGTQSNDLLALDSQTTNLSLARFAWGASGLSLLRIDQATALGLGNRFGSGFGLLWNDLNVIDPSTMAWRGSFTPSQSSAVLTSASTAASIRPTGTASFSVAWLQAPTGAVSEGWQPQFTAVVSDAALFPSPGIISRAQMVATGGQRIAVRAEWEGNGMRALMPGRIYLFDRN